MSTITTEAVAGERARLQRRVEHIRQDRLANGAESSYASRELVAAINAANASDDEIRRGLQLRAEASEWDDLTRRYRELCPEDQTVFGDLGSLRAKVARAEQVLGR